MSDNSSDVDNKLLRGLFYGILFSVLFFWVPVGLICLLVIKIID